MDELRHREPALKKEEEMVANGTAQPKNLAAKPSISKIKIIKVGKKISDKDLVYSCCRNTQRLQTE